MYTKHRDTAFLLIEDNDIDVMAIRRAMKKDGLKNELVVAQDGLDALAILRGEKPALKSPTRVIVLLDLNMPRMNGFQFLDAIRDDPELTHLVVFVLTSSDAEEDIHGAYQKHVAGYLVKQDVGSGGLKNALSLLDQYWRVVELKELESPVA